MTKLIILSLLAASVFAADTPQEATPPVEQPPVIVAEPAKTETKKLNDGLLVNYFKARAEAAEANANATNKQSNLIVAINDLRTACPTVTLDAGTGMPTCPVPAKVETKKATPAAKK